MSKYLLGIDNCSTMSKSAIFDLIGNEIAVASSKTTTLYPNPGWTERDMDQLWLSTASAIRKVLATSGINPEEIAAIGNTAHGNGLYLLDKQGKPLRNGFQSMDTRAADIIMDWHANDIYQQAFPYTTQSFWPAQPNALLSWIKTNEPENYERIGAVLLCKDFIKYQLTGEVSSDYTDMSASSMMAVREKSYSKELLELYDLSELYSALPPLKQSFDVAGRVTPSAAEQTGLKVGTPVVGGLIDIDASAIGSGTINPGQACIIAGTWSINEVITEVALVDPDLFMTTLYASPGLFLSTEASATSATNLEWFITQFCGEERIEAKKRGVSVFQICDEEIGEIDPKNSNIIFHPFLFGSNVQPSARAGFYGIGGWHTRAHLLRALYEGVAFGHLSHINKLRKAGAKIDSARLTGGGSRSHVWAQMFADVMQLPMEVPDGNEIGARGAALSAGIGVGIFSDYQDAIQQTVKVVRVHEPEKARGQDYLSRYGKFDQLITAMKEPWDNLNILN